MFSIDYIDCSTEFQKLAESFLEEWKSDKPHIVAHTSGSTGKPKEIKLLKTDIISSARSTNERFAIDNTSSLLLPLSASYIAGKMMIARAIVADCKLAITTPSNHFWDSSEIRNFILSHSPNLIPIVPSQAAILAENIEKYQSLLDATDNIIIGGAALDRSVEETLQNFNDKFFATYGMTETCSHVAIRALGDPVFDAMPGISFDTDSRDCLRIDAPQFSFKSLQTNDIAEVTSDKKSFIWRGRFDNVINSGGIKIFPEEIEKTLRDYLPDPFYIKGIKHTKWGETVELVTTAPASISDDSLISICRDRLPHYAIPQAIRRIKEIPLTSNGKIKRT